MTEQSEHPPSGKPFRVAHFVLHNSLLLIFGALVALIWANTHNDSYEHFVHFELIPNFPGMGHHEADHADDAEHSDGDVKEDHGEGGDDESEHVAAPKEEEGHHTFNVHYLINDVLMALFFAIAAKEVWEACLPGGPLSNPRKAATPLLAAFGGMAGPAALFVAGTFLVGRSEELARGWAVPCATDIAFSYMVARMIFRPGHPAIAFLLLLAIADDAGGLMILAIAYPQKPLVFAWLGLTAAAVVVALVMKKMRLHSFWWYLLIPGVMSWFSFHMAGIHAALGLVPIIPCLPHAKTDMGPYARGEHKIKHDTLNEFEHFWKNPVELFLGLFALANAGVVLDSVGSGTALVLFGLLVGKPVGITASVLVGQRLLGLQLPAGMRYKHVLCVGMIAAIGFTVALFVAVAAFPAKDVAGAQVLSEVKMGALASISAAFLAILMAKLLGVSKKEEFEPETPDGDEAAVAPDH